MKTRRMSMPAAARRGFTLVELMVAIVLLSVGVLGLASTSVMVTRMVGNGARYTIVGHVAQARFEALRAVDCTTLAGGSATARGGIMEAWSVVQQPRAVVVTDSLSYTIRGVAKSQVYQSMIPCPSLT